MVSPVWLFEPEIAVKFLVRSRAPPGPAGITQRSPDPLAGGVLESAMI